MATRIPIPVGPAAFPSRAKPAPSLLAKIQKNAEGNAETRFAEAANIGKIPPSIILRNLDRRTKIERSLGRKRVTICPDERLVVDVLTATVLMMDRLRAAILTPSPKISFSSRWLRKIKTK
jgi:hypothetical protein